MQPMLRHSRQHHRSTHRRHRARRLRLLLEVWSYPWGSFPRTFLTPATYDTHLQSPHLSGKKRKYDRRVEERRFRQAVRNALAHEDEALPILKPDWAD